jgi:hypothetical protein
MGQKPKNLIFVFLLIVILFLWSRLNSANDQLASYEDALNQANSNIEEASRHAWESYEEMGDALESLEPVVGIW